MPDQSFTVADSPLWRLSFRRLRRRPLQTVLLILGVAIGVAMMVSIDLANGSAQRAFELSTDAVTGLTTHRVVSASANGLDESVYHDLRRQLGYTLSAPVVEGYVLTPDLGNQPLRLVGIDPFAEPPFRSYFAGSSEEGFAGLVPFLTEPGAIIIAQELANNHGVQLGDELTVELAGQPLPVHVVGLLQPADDATSRALNNLIFTDIASAQEMLEMVGRLSHIDLIVENDADLQAIESILPSGTLVETAASQQNAIRQMTAAFELNLTALSMLALIVGMFLIYNTVTFSVVQRRPLFGILRCIGVTGGQLFRLILAESALLSLIGAVLGVGLGILLGRGMVGLITQTINDFYFVVNVQTVDIQSWTIIKGIVTGVAAGLLSALVPALEAARTTPQSTLQRSTLESRAKRVLPWLWLAWAILTAVGAFLLWIRASLVITFAGLFAILIAAALLTPPLTAVLMRIVSPVSRRLLGVLGRLAPRDIVRSLSRTSIAIAALMTAVSVVVGVSIMIGSFRSTVVQWLDQTLQADVYISPPTFTANRVTGTLAPEVIAEIRAWPGIENIVTSTGTDVLVPTFGRQIHLVAVDGDVSRGNRPYAWIRDDVSDPWQQLAAGEGVVISEALALKENVSYPPPPITVETPDGPRSFPVIAVFYDYTSDQGTIFMDSQLYRDLWQDPSIDSIGLFMQPGVGAEETVAALQEHFQGRQDILIQSNSSLRAGSLEVFDRTFAITAALRLLAVVVAFIGVLSALMSLQLEKARELGVLRATGMTLRQLWSLTLIQTGLMGGTAGLLAIPLGYALAWILIYVINVRSFGWTLQMQLEPAFFIQAFLVSVGAALLAGVYPSLRLGRMVIATAVREE
jgi:putative ABC transport system permease protein